MPWGHDYASRRFDGGLFLEYTEIWDLVVENTWLMMKDKHMVTYEGVE